MKYSCSIDLTWSDKLTCAFSRHIAIEDAYEKMSEFLSAWSVQLDAKMTLEPGIYTNLPISLEKYSGGYQSRRLIQANEVTETIFPIPLIDDRIKSNLCRLYREALASNSEYATFLFLWHCIVYPSENDKDGAKYIDKVVSQLPAELGHIQVDIQDADSERVFEFQQSCRSFGTYIQSDIRNSVAHIVRESSKKVSLEIDDFNQLRHLSKINRILRIIARFRMETDFNLQRVADRQTFYIIREL